MAVDVELLPCRTCGASLTPAATATVTCPSCGGETPVPAATRKVLAAREAEAGHRGEATALAARLGRVPPLPLRALAATWGVGGFVVGLPIVVAGGIVLGGALLGAYGALTHQHVHDVILARYAEPRALELALGYGVSGLAFGLWIVLAAAGARRLRGLRALQAGLVAHPPDHPGGPRACRWCGAKMEVPAGAVAIACTHCGADNLVAIPPAWVARAQARTQKLAKALGEASQAHLDEARRIRRGAIAQLVVLAVLAGGLVAMMGSIAGAGRGRRGDAHPWHAAVEPPLALRREARHARGLTGARSIAASPRVHRGGCDAQGEQVLLFGEGDCGADGCVAMFYVALRRGDALGIRGTGLPAQTIASLAAHDGDRPFDQPGWGVRVGAPARVGGGQEARLVAPHDGWYLLALTTSEGGEERVPYPMCVTLAR